MFWDNSAETEAVFVRYNIFCDATDSCLRLHGRDWTAVLTMDFNCWFSRKGRCSCGARRPSRQISLRRFGNCEDLTPTRCLPTRSLLILPGTTIALLRIVLYAHS